jgi:iron complex transport system substrate-binding protein
MRIVSLLPAATEVVAALGLLDQLVGASHECDYPPEVNALPRVTSCPLHDASLCSAEIDRRVRAAMAAGENLYRIDESLVRDLRPDLVLSQALCDVCAIGYGSVAAMLGSLDPSPRVLNLEPRRFDDLFLSISQVASAAGVPERADTLNASLRARVAAVVERARRSPAATARGRGLSSSTHPQNWGPGGRPQNWGPGGRRPRVLFLEWIDPPFGPGHWTPELIEIAGGECVVGEAGVPSTTLKWEEVVSKRAEVVVVACCGYSAERARRDLPLLERLPHWAELPAVQEGRIHVLDGSQYFSRPGPRLVDSLEILAELISP